MPDIFVYFYFLFPVFQLIILFSYSGKRHLQFSIYQISNYDTITIIIATLAIFISFYLPFHFGNKLKNKISKWEGESREVENNK